MKPHENRYLKVENFNFRDYYKVIKLKEIEWQIKHQYYGMKDRKFEATVAGLEKDRSNSLNFIDLLRELTGELLKLILDCVSSTDYARKFVSHLVRISTLAENAFKEDLFEPGEEIKIDLMKIPSILKDMPEDLATALKEVLTVMFANVKETRFVFQSEPFVDLYSQDLFEDEDDPLE